jgi:hypothetical protein
MHLSLDRVQCQAFENTVTQLGKFMTSWVTHISSTSVPQNGLKLINTLPGTRKTSSEWFAKWNGIVSKCYQPISGQ